MVRPGAIQFIESMSQFYDIILWTASLSQYANKVMDYVDPNNKAIRRMFREHCSNLNTGLTKNLASLDYNLKDIIIIDVI